MLSWCAPLPWQPLGSGARSVSTGLATRSIFLTAKKSWPEVSAAAFLGQFWHYDYVWPHMTLALAALVALAIERKRLPWVWSLFTLLYLLPSFALGMVGLGRYTNECFPPFVAAGAAHSNARPGTEGCSRSRLPSSARR